MLQNMATAPQLQMPPQSGDQSLGQVPGAIRPTPPGGSPGGVPPTTPPPLFPPQGMSHLPSPHQAGPMPPVMRFPPPGPPGPLGPPGVPPNPGLPHPGHPQPLMRMPPPVHVQQPSHPHPLPHPLPHQHQHQGPGPLGMPPPGGQMEVWLEHKTADGRTYYSHPQTQKTTWERPPNAQIIPQPPTGLPGLPPFPLPLPPPPTVPGGPQLVPTRVWSEHKTPEGKVYYYNRVTRQSMWEKPKDFELVMPLPVNFGGGPPGGMATGNVHATQPVTAPQMQYPPLLPHHHQQLQPPEEPVHTSQTGQTGQTSQISDSSQTGSPAPVPEWQKETETKEEKVMEVDGENEEQQHEEPSPADTKPSEPQEMPAAVPVIAQGQMAPVIMKEEPKGPRPIASIPVPGTPWSVVWTSDERMFYFDVTSRVSVWNMPEELSSNPHIMRIIEEPPGGRKRTGEMKSEPSAKRAKLEGGSDEEEGEGEVEGEEEGGGMVGAPVIEVREHLTEVAESEKKTAQLRAGKTPEERQRQFKEMLLERGVSAFSTWEKELPKFVFDPRYMLLNTKERKSCFEAFIRSRAEEERREKKTKLKEKKDDFKKLLEEAKLTPKSMFSDFALRYGRDERFKGIEKMREREQLFTDYTTELKKASKLKEEQQKHKAEKMRADFMAMLLESEFLHEKSQWRKVKGKFDHDPRCSAVDTSSQREEWFNEFIKSLSNPHQSNPDQERQDRIAASLKEREREVKMSRTAQEKEWGRERDQLRKTEATQHFKALLVDMVRSSDANWHETRRSLRKDQRWELAELLEIADKERLFREHVEGLTEKKRLQFRKLLEETPQITLTMPWKKARKLIKEDPRYKNFTNSDHRREAEYDKYLRDKMVDAKNEFRVLLRETKIITYKSLEMMRESDRHYKDIVDILQNDQRYLVLECVSDEREEILQSHVRELYRKGPPPPPTATNPADRLKRP